MLRTWKPSKLQSTEIYQIEALIKPIKKFASKYQNNLHNIPKMALEFEFYLRMGKFQKWVKVAILRILVYM